MAIHTLLVALLLAQGANFLRCSESNKLCRACDKHTNKCYKCADSFLNEQKECVLPRRVIPHCSFYKNDGECLECENGYLTLPGDASTCVRCEDQNCQTCMQFADTKQFCVLCDRGVQLDGKCDTMSECQGSFVRGCHINEIRNEKKEMATSCEENYSIEFDFL